ncbi:MAG TPA: ribulokinase [Planctomycetota bacterium]|nr:ribulokinase [Planctomycetota bacterium]
MQRYALGLDYGTESVRAIVVDCANGNEAAVAVSKYEHGVISHSLPGSSQSLPHDFALQHAQDYLDSGIGVIREVLKEVSAEQIVGIGVDFTACTILPIKGDGTPLMFLPEFKNNPHAWVKLWKHHAAQAQADRINEVARARGEQFLKYYGGMISSEWMLPKCWEILEHAPEVYAAADIIIDAGDWIVQQLTGQFTRNACAAGYKGFWNAELGFPSREFLGALDPKLADIGTKWLQNIVAPGRKAGEVSYEFAKKSGLKAGTPVSAATIDAHSGVPGMGVGDEGAASIIMGTSSCHMILSRELKFFEGYAGVTKDGIVPGFYGYESGQSAVGDIFGWFAKAFLPSPLRGEGRRERSERGVRGSALDTEDNFAVLSKRASALRAGQSGLLALDWMNGNRSVLMNANLSGMIAGLTLHSKPEEVYRALIEASAFGTRIILEAYTTAGIPIREVAVCGGLTRDPLLMQIYADVLNLPVKVAASDQAVALGSAILGALAAGLFDNMNAAIGKMTRPPARTYQPNAAERRAYDRLFGLYQRCHDIFGREQQQIMVELKQLRMNHQDTKAPRTD